MSAPSNASYGSSTPTQEVNPRNVIPEAGRHFHSLGWMTGSGGAIGVRRGEEIYITPSGVQKELMEPEDLFVQTIDGKSIATPPAFKKLTQSSCTPLIINSFLKRKGAGAVVHAHNPNAVLISLLYPGKEFRITHQQMIKCTYNWKLGKNNKYFDELVVPIVEGQPEEIDLAPYVAKALEDYPDTSCVIIRRHGMYVVGPTWEKTKLMLESFDYLFHIAMQMKLYGLDPTQPPT
ncbi:methylthioribulose-1-phosphate dehydratase-like isoform X1 [Mytilus trossulus]|uniref:methylthioribulose-1-phosphate dehydratase-like isoform X1 n=1 Tax=Mytilus trossulus TaxID=6551 RepID=UPI003003FF2D